MSDYIERGLVAWRENRLREIQDEQVELEEDINIEEVGLGYSFKNPGFFPRDFIEEAERRLIRLTIAWEDLERKRKFLVLQDARTPGGIARLLIAFQRERRQGDEHCHTKKGEKMTGKDGAAATAH